MAKRNVFVQELQKLRVCDFPITVQVEQLPDLCGCIDMRIGLNALVLMSLRSLAWEAPHGDLLQR